MSELETELTTEVYFRNRPTSSVDWPYTVQSGGRTIAHKSYAATSQRFHNQVLIFTLQGAGRIEAGDAVFRARKNSITWLDTSRRYRHKADLNKQWIYLWFSMAGAQLDRIYDDLAVHQSPIFDNFAHLAARFRHVIEQLQSPSRVTDARHSAEIATILAELFAQRENGRQLSGMGPVSDLMRTLRRRIDRRWTIEQMMQSSGLSQAQLFRHFKKTTGATPINWLRQERMLLAQHLLETTAKPISEVALSCGYPDPLYFSRDFKREIGQSPRSFRQTAQE